MKTWILTAALLIGSSGVASVGIPFWVESSGVMILPERPQGALKEVQRSGVRDEFVTAQLAVRCDEEQAGPLSMEWTALSGAGGQIAREHITLFREAEIVVDHGQKIDPAKDKARARVFGGFPDALVPLLASDGTNVANRIVLQKDRTIPFWVDIFIPAAARPGAYAGRIVLRSGQADVAAIPIRLTVYDLEIPAESTIPSMFNLRLHKHVRDNLDGYVGEVMRHRIQPTNYHFMDYVADQRTGWQMLDRYNPQGKGYVNVCCGDSGKLTPQKAKVLIVTLKQITAHLKARGLFDRSFLHLADEPSVQQIPAMVELAKLIIQELPAWKGKIADTLNKEGTDLDGLVTHHIRALKCYGSWYGQGERVYGGREQWDERRAAGQQLWFYLSNAQGVPYPTFDIHAVNLAWEPRVLGWAYWYEKACGHLYWDLMFKPEWQLDKKFPPGDGQLIYPGDFTLAGAPAWVLVKDLRGPVVSRRLKLQREGLEEWELLKMAENKIGRQRVQAIVDRVYTYLGKRTWAPDAYDPAKPMWSYDEGEWDKSRQEIIDALR